MLLEYLKVEGLLYNFNGPAPGAGARSVVLVELVVMAVAAVGAVGRARGAVA